jgi:hypothetical protein
MSSAAVEPLLPPADEAALRAHADELRSLAARYGISDLHFASALAGLLLLLASCSDTGERLDAAGDLRDQAVMGADTSTSIVPRTSPAPTPGYLAGDSLAQRFDPESYDEVLSFWAPVANGYSAALEPEYFERLDDMITSATVVVIGEVLSAGVTRTLGDPQGEEAPPIDFWGVELKLLGVLSGDLHPKSGTEIIIVETHFRPGDIVPRGAGVFALRHKLDMSSRRDPLPGAQDRPPPKGEDDKYRLVSTQGIFVDSDEGVRNPIAEAVIAGTSDDDDVARDPIAEEVRGLSVDQLIDEITRAAL